MQYLNLGLLPSIQNRLKTHYQYVFSNKRSYLFNESGECEQNPEQLRLYLPLAMRYSALSQKKYCVSLLIYNRYAAVGVDFCEENSEINRGHITEEESRKLSTLLLNTFPDIINLIVSGKFTNGQQYLQKLFLFEATIENRRKIEGILKENTYQNLTFVPLT